MFSRMRAIGVATCCWMMLCSLTAQQPGKKPKLTQLEFMLDDKPCSAWIDPSFKNFKNKRIYSLSLFITVTTAEKDKNGAPTPAEAKVFTSLEQDILTKMTALNACYVGRTTMNGYRDILLYIRPADREKATNLLNPLKKKYSRVTAFTYQEDPRWDAVAEFYGAVK